MTTEVRNGIAVEQLNGMIEAVKANPGLAQAVFTTNANWREGFRSDVSIGNYEQGGEVVERGRTFVVQGDHPEGLLGNNQAPAAVETLIAATAQCIAGGWATFGAALDIPVEALEIRLQGDIDLQGFMGLGEGIQPGLARIHGQVRVKSPASTEALQQLKTLAEQRSPVVDSLRVKVETELERIEE